MLDTLTYPQFHALFVVPPIAALAGLAAWRHRDRLAALVAAVSRSRPPALDPSTADPSTGRGSLPDASWRRSTLSQTGAFLVVVTLAVVYTTPWDNYLIGQGVWSYGAGRVAARVWRAPVSEYLFFVLQPVVTALWLAHLPGGVRPGARQGGRDTALGAAAGLAVSGAGLGLIALGPPDVFYLGAILAWAGPVLALQWAVGWRYLWRVRARVAAAVLVPTAYFTAVDAVALSAGVWTIADRYATGLALGVVPVEEAAFFLVTNLFVVQALVLFPWVVVRASAGVLAVRQRRREGARPRLLPRVVRRWR